MIWKILAAVLCVLIALVFYSCCCVASEADRQMEAWEERREREGEDHSSTGI